MIVARIIIRIMRHIWILTNCFPFYPGEQFLETEMLYWAKVPNLHLTILPSSACGAPRSIPANASLDLSLARRSLMQKVLSCALVFFSPLFYCELRSLLSERRTSLSALWHLFQAIASTLHKYRILKARIKQTHGAPYFYSYWFDTVAYASALLARKGLISGSVARAHRFDVYEAQRPNNYMPLKRQFIHDFDCVYAISTEGLSYLYKQYGIPVERLAVARLGVQLADDVKLNPPTPSGCLTILSVSFCVPVKRIDRIIDAVACLSDRTNGRISLKWTHIGAGPLEEHLKAQAQKSLGKSPNTHWRFMGSLTNREVLDYLHNEPTDVFINCSESEGLPVSIMEAMGAGIPAVAPSVGGISELVNSDNGVLLSPEPSVSEIADALSLRDHLKNPSTRRLAHQIILEQFNAKDNYSNFIGTILERMQTAAEVPRTSGRRK